MSYYNSIIENVDIEINEETKIKILDMILNLYVRVRTNSLTKDVKYKRKSLRKNIKGPNVQPIITCDQINLIPTLSIYYEAV